MIQNNVYTVEKVNKYIKNMFTQDYLLKSLSVKGEISNCKYHPTGHIYFTLKDSGASLKCVMFAGKRMRGLDFKLEDGQQVIVTGAVDVYLDGGTYQLYADKIILDGIGELYEKYEQLKNELEELGMFDSCYKQPVPTDVKTLGVVTASSGAAIRDIINVSKRRNPYIQIILYPAIVQGPDAASSIVKGIKALEKYGVDLMIVGRGGGSIEDLWAFNEKQVAQAIFDCRVPIISAVGHEIDFTIADFVADKRAATPSQAAEFAVTELRQTDEAILLRKNNLNRAMAGCIDRYRKHTEYIGRQLFLLSPSNRLRETRQRVLKNSDRMDFLFSKILGDRKNRLSLAAARLDGVSPLKRLDSGYAYVSDKAGKRIKSVAQIGMGDELELAFKDGRITAEVKDIKNDRY